MLLDFLETARLDRVGAFTYSEVEGADANKLENHVPEEVKQKRHARLMEVQSRISLEKNLEKIGRVLEVVIDEFNDESEDASGTKLIGRSKGDAPGIDGQVYIAAGSLAGKIKIGDIVTVRIEDADEYDLFGEAERILEWKPNMPQFQTLSSI